MNGSPPPDSAARARRFADLHVPGVPLLMPNAWDAGSARLLAAQDFGALATTSSGFAATLGRLDGSVTRDEALGHAAGLVGAVEVPVSADLENGFGTTVDEVAQTAAAAVSTGLAGFSIEDYSGDDTAPIYPLDQAVERVRAAAAEAHRGPAHVVLTARCENHLHGVDDLQDTISRLQAYEAAGADVLFAPGVRQDGEIAALVGALTRPVSVLALPGAPPVTRLAELGVSRVSVGGAFTFAALAAVLAAATELREHGTYGYLERSALGNQAARAAFGTA